MKYFLLSVFLCLFALRNRNHHYLYTYMKEFAKYTGAVVMLIGVALLTISFFSGTISNTSLIIGLLLIIEGFLGHIYVNNMKKGNTFTNILWAIILLVVPYFIFLLAKKKAYSKEEIAAYN